MTDPMPRVCPIMCAVQEHYRKHNQMTYSRCLFVIHNMAHQGRAPFDEIHNLEFSNEAKEQFRWGDTVRERQLLPALLPVPCPFIPSRRLSPPCLILPPLPFHTPHFLQAVRSSGRGAHEHHEGRA